MTEAHILTPQELEIQIQNLNGKVVARDHQIIVLEEQLAWFRNQLFGKKSEKIVADLNIEQLSLAGFDTLPTKPPLAEEPAKNPPEGKGEKRKSQKRNGQDKITLPDNLPVVTTILGIPEEQKVCQETCVALVKIGEEISHKLAHTPGSYYIKETIRPKYAHPSQEEKGILTADLPDNILPKCRAENTFLAELLTQKFADHLPLYRISEILSRDGIGISRKLLSQWVVRLGMALTPLYNVMLKKLLGSGNIYVDESPVNVQDEGKVRQGYMWVVVGGNEANPPHRIYGFSDRSYKNIFEMLEGYKGVLHSDKYGAYEQIARWKDVEWCPCWAHIRRKFFEAESGDPAFRTWVLRQIRYLYMFEKIGWTKTAEERLNIREEKEVPIINQLTKKILDRLGDEKLLPKSKFRGAMAYYAFLTLYLKNYTKHPFARMDNNVAERAVRPLALGRKNWLFFGSDAAGQSAAVIFSLIETCRGLEINPREYLSDIFGKLPSYNSKKLEELLPDQWLANRKKTS